MLNAQEPRTHGEKLSFVRSTSGGVSIAADGLYHNLLTVQIDEGQAGKLLYFGLNVTPLSSAEDITFQLRINTAGLPRFGAPPNSGAGGELQINANTLATPLPFEMDLAPGQLLVLAAKNAGAAPILVDGTLLGYTRRIIR